MSRSDRRNISLRSGARGRLPGLALGHLPDQLERDDPPLRPLPVLGQLPRRELEAEDLAEERLHLFVGEEQVRGR